MTPGADAAVDTGTPFDSGPPRDTGPRDTGVDTGSPPDSSTPDVGVDAGPVCGDGTVATGEGCDDDNTTDGDGCDSSCVLEAGWDCSTTSPTACTEICGDGITVGLEAGALGCDDGDLLPGDGCDDMCAVEIGFSCTGEPSVCTTGCGDGITAGSEACDDGAMVDGDGCSSACAIETGYMCAGTPSACTSTCGDGIVAAGDETCDDGLAVDGDGCSALCATEAGFVCTGAPSVCATMCGDGVVAGAEACDELDTVEGDGCDTNCTVTACGNGIMTTGEFCDDSNTTSGDGCHADCISELEREPNEDGTPSTGGSGTTGNDFDAAGGSAVAAANNNGIITDTFVMRAAFATAGDEDVFALANVGLVARIFTIETYQAADGTCPTLDTVITVRDDMGVSIRQDDDGSAAGACSLMRLLIPAGETYYIHVTEFGDNDAAALYFLSISQCGDAAATGSEICDDGNAVEGDACDSNCSLPACGNGITAGTEVCDDGNSVNGDTCDNNCTVPACGNGVRVAPETCDDGNTAPADGCSMACAVETGFACTTAIPNVCTPLCGNGVVNSGEGCDDMNTVGGDGCTMCAIDAGSVCAGAPSTCRPRGVGDTCAMPVAIAAPVTLTAERLFGDIGAASACAGSGALARWYTVSVPAGRTAVLVFTSTGTPTWDPIIHRVASCVAATCTNTNSTGSGGVETLTLDNSAGLATLDQLIAVESNSATTNGTYNLVVSYPVCGNGAVEAPEACDDMGVLPGDGCSATCTVEAGYVCTGAPSTCGLITACPAGQTAVSITGTPLPALVPDNMPGAGPVISFATTGVGTIVRVQLGISVTHTFDADLDMLLSVGGTTVDVSTDNGGSGDNYTDTLFSSSCATAVTAGAAPFTGCFRPEQDFAMLAPQPLGSTYTLRVSDDLGGDLGTVTSATLFLCTTP